MPPTIVVLIQEDPLKSHRPAEALRIALGLSTGPNPLQIVLLDRAPLLLTEDASDSVDGEILERHLPVIQELGIPIIVPQGSHNEFSFDPGFTVSELPEEGIANSLSEAERVLIF